VVECALIAFGQAVPESTSALWTRHLHSGLTGKRRDRIDPRTGTVQYYAVTGFQDGGNGAIYGYDGTDSFSAYNGAGTIMKPPFEVLEWTAPYRWLRHEFVTDACGHGKWRGGLGNYEEVINICDPAVWQPHDCVVMTGSFDGENSEALGLLGGTAGNKHKLGIIRDGKTVKLRTLSSDYLEPGDIVWSQSGGGGGVGDPLDRDIEKVRWDVLNEYISPEVAKNVYGVVIDPDTLAVDEDATNKLRESQKRRLNDEKG